MVAAWTTWKMLRGVTEETELYDAMVVDAFNRFARRSRVVLNDPDGTKKLLYPKGTLVTLQVEEKGTTGFVTQFGGFVIDITLEQDTTILDCLSHDFWLRKREVFKTYTSQTLSYILNDLITSLTPIIWDAGLVDVLDDITITRTWKGEKLDEVIREISTMSTKEEFGATDDRKFFFRPREDSTSPRDFTDGEWATARFPEEAKEEVNKVTVYYGEPPNTASVSVQDLIAQQDLADKIGSSSPVVLEANKAHPEIDNEDAARLKARAVLDAREPILIGELNTWGAFDVSPGDVTHVEVPDEDVDGFFRVAELQYNLLANNTVVRVAENREGVIDSLLHMSEEITRVDMKTADLLGTRTEVIEIPTIIELEISLKVYTMIVSNDAFIFGERFGGFGEPDIGGGLLGDQRGPKAQVIP